MILTPPGKGGLILPQLTSGICFVWEMSVDTVLSSGAGAAPQYWQNLGTEAQCSACSSAALALGSWGH